jgi:hypothetical protein
MRRGRCAAHDEYITTAITRIEPDMYTNDPLNGSLFIAKQRHEALLEQGRNERFARAVRRRRRGRARLLTSPGGARFERSAAAVADRLCAA